MNINTFKKKFFFIKKFIFSIYTPSIQFIEQNLFNVYRNFFKVRVFDCFIFNTEIDLLNLRLDYLKDTVDIFVIVESKLTFTNNLKEKYFAEEFINDLPNDLKKKIRYIQINPKHIPENIKNEPWEVEGFIKNGILFGLTDVRDFDFLWISDLDEIPNKNKVFRLGRLSMFFSYYKMNLLKNYYWRMSVAILGKHIKNTTHYNIRRRKWFFGNDVKNGGWHFSYLMNEKEIREKVKTLCETHFAKEKFINLQAIQNAIKNKKDLFGRPSEDLKLVKDLSFLPDIVLENLEKYKKFIED